MRRRTPLRVEMVESRCLLSALAYSLTTNQSTYQAGQPIQFTFTETNTGSTPVGIELGPSNSGFDVAQNGATVWASNAGNQPYYVQLRILQPGQSVTLTATWNGVSNVGTATAVTGTFTATNQQAPTGASATFVIEPQSTGGATSSGPTHVGTNPFNEPASPTSTQPTSQPLPIVVLPTNGFVRRSLSGQLLVHSAV
jgi:hypothetical protein